MLAKRLRLVVVLGLAAIAAFVGTSAVSAFDPPFLTDCEFNPCPPQAFGPTVGTCTKLFANGFRQTCRVVRPDIGGGSEPWCIRCP